MPDPLDLEEIEKRETTIRHITPGPEVGYVALTVAERDALVARVRELEKLLVRVADRTPTHVILSYPGLWGDIVAAVPRLRKAKDDAQLTT